MIFRFFVVLYVICLLAIVGWWIYAFPTNVHLSEARISNYQAKCISNDRYVILQGGSTPYEFAEKDLKTTEFSDTPQDLNFYCKYYDQIQPHIQTYINAKSLNEKYEANTAFHTFEQSVGRYSVSRTPALYNLETTRVENNYTVVLLSALGIFLGGVVFFLVLQILRMIYLYITFGEIIWHPFRKPKTLKISNG